MKTAIAVRTYDVDKDHSEAGFQVRHLLTKARGRFSDFTGTIDLDEATPEAAAVRFTVNTASVDTHAPDRDAHLRSEDFFAVERFPTLTFESRSISPKGGDQYDVSGDLTIRGVTRRIVVPVTYLGKAQDPWGNERLAFEAAVTINRKDFGLNWNAAIETGGFLVGDEVHVSVSIQAVATK